MTDREFKQAMGKFATGVTIITTEVDGKPHGMTANAFMSVSLNPKLVLISIMDKSTTLCKIQQSGRYAVNILAEDQKDLSQRFASRDKKVESVAFDYLDGMPVIPGALAQVVCDVSSEYVEGDHTLFVGRVTEIRVNDGEPLIYSGGRYRTLHKETEYQKVSV